MRDVARLVERQGRATAERATLGPRHASDIELFLVRPWVLLEVQVLERLHQRPQVVVRARLPVTERSPEVESALCATLERVYPLSACE